MTRTASLVAHISLVGIAASLLTRRLNDYQCDCSKKLVSNTPLTGRYLWKLQAVGGSELQLQSHHNSIYFHSDVQAAGKTHCQLLLRLH